ncbi:MAG: hypothetical protein HC851_19095 [Acaryochloris sp. RU_4_1]|nr:hypothetical protein [Acaryochloris sp. RU_4_1]NJR56373.1 hypothetical protein [Acaryochloris sp. CRU_2_0]
MGTQFWYETYVHQCTHLAQLQNELTTLQETLRKLTQRSSENSSVSPSQAKSSLCQSRWVFSQD